MKKSMFVEPYKDTRTRFPETLKKSGVYLIKENDQIVYVGYSESNLYKTMYRHFQTWNHTGQEVNSYKTRMKKNRYTVRVILCTPAQARRLEKMLIISHNPRDNGKRPEDYTRDKWDEYTMQQYKAAQPATVEDLF